MNVEVGLASLRFRDKQGRIVATTPHEMLYRETREQHHIHPDARRADPQLPISIRLRHRQKVALHKIMKRQVLRALSAGTFRDEFRADRYLMLLIGSVFLGMQLAMLGLGAFGAGYYLHDPTRFEDSDPVQAFGPVMFMLSALGILWAVWRELSPPRFPRNRRVKSVVIDSAGFELVERTGRRERRAPGTSSPPQPGREQPGSDLHFSPARPCPTRLQPGLSSRA